MDHSMDHMSMPTQTLMNISATTTMSNMAASTTAVAVSHSHMAMGSGNACKISMLFNWYTIDACFLDKSWHITTKAQFAGSCIGVILLVLTLELFRHLAIDYDRSLLRQYQRQPHLQPATGASFAPGNPRNKTNVAFSRSWPIRGARPSIAQQLLRSILHLVQFAAAYIVMLLAMSFNLYFIICIFIGAFLGFFMFNWEPVVVGDSEEPSPTGCCG